MFKAAVIGFGSVALAHELAKEEFVDFIGKYNKAYTAEEFGQKLATFSDNLKTIKEHNAKHAAGQATHFMAVNEFTDLTADEFSFLFKGYIARDQNKGTDFHVNSGVQDAAVDWRTQGAVTPVKDQGQCGSCWAFSTTGSVEGVHYLKSNQLVSVAEQQLVDCAGSSGNQGCNGGLMDDAFDYIIKNGGITQEDNYPYKARGGICNKNVVSAYTISSYKDVRSRDESALENAVNSQPVSVAVDASKHWQMYGGGILSTCTGHGLDHGVLAVGYGTESGTDYWIVKNSWGTGWGENGYIRLQKGMNPCGIADQASYPVA